MAVDLILKLEFSCCAAGVRKFKEEIIPGILCPPGSSGADDLLDPSAAGNFTVWIVLSVKGIGLAVDTRFLDLHLKKQIAVDK